MHRAFEKAAQGGETHSRTPLLTEALSLTESAEDAIEVDVSDASSQWLTLLFHGQPHLALGLLASLGCLVLAGGASLWHGGQTARDELRQERNLRILEGIRNLGSAPTVGEAPAANPRSDGLPPPPPSEPWIEELGQLEGGSPAAAPLQVPLNGTLQATAPQATGNASGPANAGSDAPELLGVVQIPGKPGSAIFQLGGSSTNALVGEMIGSSGWKLMSTSGDSAVIERGGTSRRVSISSGF